LRIGVADAKVFRHERIVTEVCPIPGLAEIELHYGFSGPLAVRAGPNSPIAPG
jgi:hypothetical protein